MDADEARYAAKQAAKAASRLAFIQDVAKERAAAAGTPAGGAAHATPPLPLRPLDAGLTVCVRKRPLNAQEAREGQYDVITPGPDGSRLTVHEPKLRYDLSQEVRNHAFVFDRVFGEGASNDDVYGSILAPLLPGLAAGRQVSVFAYGQTGSGKSHTMTGLVERAVRDVFGRLVRLGGVAGGSGGSGGSSSGLVSSRLLAAATSSTSSASADAPDVVVCVSFYELYCSRVYDLLDDRRLLVLREDASAAVQVVGLTEHATRDPEVVRRLLARGLAARSVGTTRVNAASSRSHSVLQLLLRDGAAGGRLLGKLTLVDLAGSEGAHEAAPPDKTTHTEAAEINKSLLALKECIRAMSTAATGGGTGSGFVPFRGSKLTQILRDSFTHPGAATVMVATLGPGNASVEHSLNTLRYADRLKGLSSSGGGGSSGAAAGAGAHPSSAAAAAIARAVRDRPATAGGSTPYYDRALPASPPHGSAASRPGSSSGSAGGRRGGSARPLSDNTAGRRVGVLWNGGLEVTPPLAPAEPPPPLPVTVATVSSSSSSSAFTTAPLASSSAAAAIAATVAGAATATATATARGGSSSSSSTRRRGAPSSFATRAAASAVADGVAAASAAAAVDAAAGAGTASAAAARSPRRGQPWAWTLTRGGPEAAAAVETASLAVPAAATSAPPPLPPPHAAKASAAAGAKKGGAAAKPPPVPAPAPARPSATGWEPVPSLLAHDTLIALGPGASSRGARHTFYHQQHTDGGCDCGDVTPTWALGGAGAAPAAPPSATAVTAARLLPTDGVTTRHRSGSLSSSGLLDPAGLQTRLGADAVGGPLLASSALLASAAAPGSGGGATYTVAMGLPPSGPTDLHTAAVARLAPATLGPSLYPAAPVAAATTMTAGVSRATGRRGSASSTGSAGSGSLLVAGSSRSQRRPPASRSASPAAPRAPLAVKPVPLPVAAIASTGKPCVVAPAPAAAAVAAWAPASDAASAPVSPLTPPRTGRPAVSPTAAAASAWGGVSPALLSHPAIALATAAAGADPFATRSKLQHTPIRTKRELLFGSPEAAAADLTNGRLLPASAAASVAATPVAKPLPPASVGAGSEGGGSDAGTPMPSAPPTPLVLARPAPSVTAAAVPPASLPPLPAPASSASVAAGSGPSAEAVIALIDAQIKQLNALKAGMISGGSVVAAGEAAQSTRPAVPASRSASPAPPAAAPAPAPARGRSASPAPPAAAVAAPTARRRSVSGPRVSAPSAAAAALAEGLGLPSAADASLLIKALAMPAPVALQGPESLQKPVVAAAAPQHAPAPLAPQRRSSLPSSSVPAAPAPPAPRPSSSHPKGPQPAVPLVASPTRADKPTKKAVAPPPAPGANAAFAAVTGAAGVAGAVAAAPRAGGPGGGVKVRHHAPAPPAAAAPGLAVGLPFPIPAPSTVTMSNGGDARALLRAAASTPAPPSAPSFSAPSAPHIIRGSEALAVGDLLRQLQSKVSGSVGAIY